MRSGKSPKPFLELTQVPTHVGRLWDSREAARSCPRGDIALSLDTETGFIYNARFDESLVDYTGPYDDALHHSPSFREFEAQLAAHLVERYDLHSKYVVEIGAGSGRFLDILCSLGRNRGTGYDPSHDPARIDTPLNADVRIIREYYSPRNSMDADFVCCRQVLEHIPDPMAFLRQIRDAAEPTRNTVFYFEVPNTNTILRDMFIWDIIYEHVGYFVPESLRALFEQSGFEVVECCSSYGGQFLGIEVRIGEPSRTRVSFTTLGRTTSAFAHRFHEERARWQHRLEDLEEQGQRVVVWGAGSKGVSFFNLLRIGNAIEYVVDINPGKQGHFLPGTGQMIVAPEFIRDYRPDLVLIMNPLYEREIAMAVSSLSPAARVMTV